MILFNDKCKEIILAKFTAYRYLFMLFLFFCGSSLPITLASTVFEMAGNIHDVIGISSPRRINLPSGGPC